MMKWQIKAYTKEHRLLLKLVIILFCIFCFSTIRFAFSKETHKWKELDKTRYDMYNIDSELSYIASIGRKETVIYYFQPKLFYVKVYYVVREIDTDTDELASLKMIKECRISYSLYRKIKELNRNYLLDRSVISYICVESECKAMIQQKLLNMRR